MEASEPWDGLEQSIARGSAVEAAAYEFLDQDFQVRFFGVANARERARVRRTAAEPHDRPSLLCMALPQRSTQRPEFKGSILLELAAIWSETQQETISFLASSLTVPALSMASVSDQSSGRSMVNLCEVKP